MVEVRACTQNAIYLKMGVLCFAKSIMGTMFYQILFGLPHKAFFSLHVLLCTGFDLTLMYISCK